MVHHFRRVKGTVRSYLDTVQKKLAVIAGIVGSISIILGFAWTYGPRVMQWYDKRVVAAAAMEKVPEQVAKLQKQMDRVDSNLELLLRINGIPQNAVYAKRFETKLDQ